MKRHLFISLALVMGWGMMLTILTSCNGDVFVDDMGISGQKLELPTDGTVRTIDFKDENWNIAGVYEAGLETDDIFLNSIKGEVYDDRGYLLSSDEPLRGDGLVKLVARHPLMALTIERTTPRQLRFTATENPTGWPLNIDVVVEDDLVRQRIRLTLLPSEPYRLDSIDYELTGWFYDDNICMNLPSDQFSNPTDHELTACFTPYADCAEECSFMVDAPGSLNIFGKEPPLVPLVNLNAEGFPYITDRSVPFTWEVQRFKLPDEMLDVREAVVLAPGETCYTDCTVWFTYTGFIYRAWATHPRTGRQQALTGRLELTRPTRYDFKTTPSYDYPKTYATE